jgi:hypothetical protein
MGEKFHNCYENSIPEAQKNTTTLQGQCHLEMGWALSKARSGSTRFPTNVHDYLVKKFEYGQIPGHKCTPLQVSLDMRHAMDEVYRDL